MLGQCEDISPNQCCSPSLLETLKRRQKELASRLDDVTAAVNALETNPEISKVLELVARAR